MGKSAKKSPIVPPTPKITSRKHARKVTSAYHKITAQMKVAGSASELAACASELAEIGGVMAYQQASALNTALNKTSAWVVQVLRQRKLLKRDARLRVLEVGAINTQLLEEPELATRSYSSGASAVPPSDDSLVCNTTKSKARCVDSFSLRYCMNLPLAVSMRACPSSLELATSSLCLWPIYLWPLLNP